MSAATASFSVQDLASQATKVLDAVRRFGSASIHTSDGETFEMIRKQVPKSAAADLLAKYQAHAERLKEMGLVQPTSEENDRINHIIAGEA